MAKLTTRQRNALRRLLGKPELAAAEVAALGYRRLARAPRLGEAGLEGVLAWLADQGYPLERPAPLHELLDQLREQARSLRLRRERGLVVLELEEA